jgi:hypothetical protein
MAKHDVITKLLPEKFHIEEPTFIENLEKRHIHLKKLFIRFCNISFALRVK